MPQNHILVRTAEGTPMESHPYTKPRGVGPVTTQLTPGAEPASSKSAGAPGPSSCSPTCRAWSESQRRALSVWRPVFEELWRRQEYARCGTIIVQSLLE